MKFEAYLEAIKQDVLNELFNIKKQNIKLGKIKYSKGSKDFIEIIYDLIRDNEIRDPKDLLSINIEDLKNIKFFIHMIPKIKETFFKNLENMKSGKYYIQSLKKDNEKSFIFTVGETFYVLFLKEKDGVIEISFDKLLANKEPQFRSNKLMKISGAKDELFNKIRTIIENEYKTNLKTKVFAFLAAFDNQEDFGNANFFIQSFYNQLENYLTGKKINLNDLNESLKEFSNKNKIVIKNYLKQKILNNQDALNFLNSIFSFKEPSSPSKKLNSFKIKIDEKEILKTLIDSSMRQKLYKEVIRSLFGNKVIIKPSETLIKFSLKDFKA